jgi:hypothetical protein
MSEIITSFNQMSTETPARDLTINLGLSALAYMMNWGRKQSLTKTTLCLKVGIQSSEQKVSE